MVLKYISLITVSIIWIYLSTFVIGDGNVCDPDKTIVYICTNDTENGVRKVSLDTSRTPVQDAVTCVCTIWPANGSISVQSQIKFHFEEGYNIAFTNFTLYNTETNNYTPITPGKNDVRLLSDNGLKMVYQQPENHQDQSCLSLEVNSPQSTINVQCDTKSNHDPKTDTEPTTNTDVTTGNTGNMVPIILGVLCGFAVSVLTVVIIIFLVRRRRSKPSIPGNQGTDDNEDEEVENPMYNTEVDGAGDESTFPTKLNENYIYPKDEQVANETSTNLSKGSNPGNIYTLPHDSIVQTNQDGYEYSTPEKENSKKISGDDGYAVPHDEDFSYTTISDQNNTSKSGTSNISPTPKAFNSGTRNDDHVYNHTSDKELVVPMHEYSRVRNVADRNKDYLNTYDTAVNVSSVIKPDRQPSETEDFYDKTS